MNSVLFSSNSVEWETPQELFDSLNEEFHFTLDPCSTDLNAKCHKHFTKEQDGLSQDWSGEIVYCNPPYGREMPKWIKKCYEHYIGGGVLLLCLFLHELTRKHSMSTFTGRQKFGLFVEDCGLVA